VAVDRTHRLWLGTLNAHVRAVHAHEVAAALSERIGDTIVGAIEARRAASERTAYAYAVAEHPEWSVDRCVGITGEREERVGAGAGYVAGAGDRERA
jgi:hypothetical protein